MILLIKKYCNLIGCETPGQIESNAVASDATFPWWLAIRKKGILEPNWTRGTTDHTLTKGEISDVTFHWWLTPCKKTISFDSFLRHWWSKNLTIWFHETQTWPHPTKSVSLRCYLPLMTISMQRSYVIIRLFPEILLIEDLYNWQHPTKSSSARCYLSLMVNSM